MSGSALQSEPSPSSQETAPGLPVTTLPKGGGAIRGIGEKFAANPVTGAGSMSIPIAVSPNRQNFGPKLSLVYDSSFGNGPFGFGWHISQPSITRKTEKGLPHYCDADESDIFILSGAEDLVPLLQPDGTRHRDETTAPGYTIHRYRPRIEGLFARIERWTRGIDDDVHWRSISKDNVLTIYGGDRRSRIADPADATRIFSWLICETRDDRGNAIVYEYKPEDDTGIDSAKVNERNRDSAIRSANRYPKRIKYGNRDPLLDNAGRRPQHLTQARIDAANWMFEVVFDYDDHDAAAPRPGDDEIKDALGKSKFPWKARQDPFSTYRAGFEIRTYRLCQRVLMFHHFAAEADVGLDCLVRSTDLEYTYERTKDALRDPIYSFLLSARQTGYRRVGAGGYLARSMPAIEFEYSQPRVQDRVDETDAVNLPVGLDGTRYQWTDLHGEGLPGILSEQAQTWFYLRNLSPLPVMPGDGPETVRARFASVEAVTSRPNLSLATARFMDLAGDGQPDLVMLDGPLPGLYEHDEAEGWQPFRPFDSRVNRGFDDPSLRFIDLNGDGHADLLITENDALVWHQSLGEGGFGMARRRGLAPDEEKGPRLVFADSEQSIHLADMSGDGLTDLVRIRNGEICYWPNLGHGRFGAKVAMDFLDSEGRALTFDHPDQFDLRRLRLADIDGSGTTDILYLHRAGVRLYFNQSGNGFGSPHILTAFPHLDNVVTILPVDLLGNSTACLVWSSPLGGNAGRPMRYVDLMGGQKPHLLIRAVNNMGAETVVHYAPSTRFYLQDKRAGRPWLTRLPFPVHVVERVETYDRVSRSRFISRYAYHHGYFDGAEREFRGFGMVEQWDTEEIGKIPADERSAQQANWNDASHVPPIHTKTWFHTGMNLGRDHVSDTFAGLLTVTDPGEYFREPGLTIGELRSRLLPDTVLPPGLTMAEEREACRALKGAMLRQEVYADDAPLGVSGATRGRDKLPYTVIEQNFTVARSQPKGDNRHAVFFTFSRETLTYHYERTLFPVLNGQSVDGALAANPAVTWRADPRVQHALTLEVDAYGNVLKHATIGYGRRYPDSTLPTDADRRKQTLSLVTVTESRMASDPVTGVIDTAYDHRTPLPAEHRTYELTGFLPKANAAHFTFEQMAAASATAALINYENPPTAGLKQKRLIEHSRTYFRRDDLTGRLPLGTLEARALPFESYQLAFTPGLLAKVFVRGGQALIPNPALFLSGTTSGRGGYVDLNADGQWWIPSGRAFYSPEANDPTAVELAFARQHFFLPHRHRDPFGQMTFVLYDSNAAAPPKNHNLMTVKTTDAVGNVTTTINNYRVLQPVQLTDPNGNRSQVRFDVLGMVVGTAVMGKAGIPQGDTFDDFVTDLTPLAIRSYFDAADPRLLAGGHLGTATTRILYDLDRIPACAAAIARETHVSDLPAGEQSKLHLNFHYSDGFGREIQTKTQAESGPVPRRDASGKIMLAPNRQPLMTPNSVSPRWSASGWTILNNKGKPVRQFEPFFSDTHRHEFEIRAGVSPVLFYDPAGRVTATLHPDHSWDKVVFDPWRQTAHDTSDTLKTGAVAGNPKTDPEVATYFERQPDEAYLPGWHALRTDPAHALAFAALYPDAADQANETAAAVKAAAYSGTPTTIFADTLGRPFLSILHNKVICPGHLRDGTEEKVTSRAELDIEGNQRAVRDAIVQGGDPLGRIVLQSEYDILGNRIRQASMEAGERWMLNDATGKPIRAWNSRGHDARSEYDAKRRPLRSFVIGADPGHPNTEVLVERLIYGEQHPQAEQHNLRGAVYLHLDQAGVVSSEERDFKGNLLRASRRLATDYKQTIDWQDIDANHAALPEQATDKLNAAALEGVLAPLLENDTYESRTRYDALGRPTQLIAPRSGSPGSTLTMIQPTYNVARLLECIDVWLDEATEPVGKLDPATASLRAVQNIEYDAKGQRTSIEYGSGAGPGRIGTVTTYDYDPLTLRLTRMVSRRSVADDCPQPPPNGWPGCQLQSLRYGYDPAGNITSIRDDAQQTVFFKNRRVEPSAYYTYDALYRLIEATGREHLGQTAGTANAPSPHSYGNSGSMGVPSTDGAGKFAANDGKAMGAYTERYVYDAVGNFLSMQHLGTDPAHPGWTRSYSFNENSLIEPGKRNNRLTSTTIGNGAAEDYDYDAHGNMLRMPQMQQMLWDDSDRLRMTQRQKVDNQDVEGTQRHGERTWYVYDAAGQRVRKVTELANGGMKEERIYLGGIEIYRRHAGAHAGLVRETLHIMDDTKRVALVETRNAIDDGTAKRLIRYQLSNHLGSSNLELDDQAQIISYEEYTPYGSTSYQAVRSVVETPKRYRFTGKERDTETGLSYHGARYYAAWLGRWVSCDPVSIAGGLNVYAYGNLNPVKFSDKTGLTPDDPVPDLSDFAKSDRSSSGVPGSHGGGLASLAKEPKTASLLSPAKHTASKKPAAKQAPQQAQTAAQSMANLKVMAELLQTKLTYPKPVRQAAGVAQLFSGSLEAGAGLLASETGAGLFLYFHGIDVASSGLVTAITGESSPTYTFQLGRGAATAAGADPKMANAVGQTTEIFGNAASAGLSLQLATKPVTLAAAGDGPVSAAAGGTRDMYQLNRVANPTRGQVLRTLREIGTDESLATAKLISRGDVELSFRPTDPMRQGAAGRQPFGTNRLEIYLDKLPATNRGLAGLVGHEAFHYVQGITPGTYTLTHELEAYTWGARISSDVTNPGAELLWMEMRYQSLLTDPLYLSVRRY